MRFKGKLLTIHKDFLSSNYIVSFEMEEGSLEQADKIIDKELIVNAEPFKDLRSGEANRLLWDCIGKIAKFQGRDKWEVYLEELKKYGQYTYACIKPEAVEAFKESWRECEEIGELEINGRKAVQLLCYFGSSTYTTKEFAQLLDGVIDDLTNCGLDRPLSKEMKRALEQWNQYCKQSEGALSAGSGENSTATTQ